jgi:hypothetical protein
MKEPVRLIDPRSYASHELRSLLAVAEPPAALPTAARERVRRALARRAAATERTAVCWSHTFGFVLALATCLVWLLPQREPDAERSLVRARSAHAAPSSAAPASARAEPRALPEVAVVAQADQVIAPAPAQHAVAERSAIARRATPRKHPGAGPARSRKRIAAVVDGILKPEAQQLDRARREAERDPEQALALIDAFRRDHPRSALPAPIAVAEVDALRRLGRFEEALAKARALLEGSRKPYYADEMAQRFALLDL